MLNDLKSTTKIKAILFDRRIVQQQACSYGVGLSFFKTVLF